MSSTPRARPTIYRGVQYRSRLEATWAAFFDLAGIRALYEGREDLRGYIPDFELVLADGYRCVAEVKPAHGAGDFDEARKKYARAGGQGMCLMLGLDPAVFFGFVPPQGKYPGGFAPADWAVYGVTAPGETWAHAQNATQWRAPR